MAVDTSIALQSRAPNIFGALQQGVQLGGMFQQLRNRPEQQARAEEERQLRLQGLQQQLASGQAQQEAAAITNAQNAQNFRITQAATAYQKVQKDVDAGRFGLAMGKLRKEKKTLNDAGVVDTPDIDAAIGALESGEPEQILGIKQIGDQVMVAAQQRGLFAAPAAAKLSSVQQKVLSEGIDPNTPEGQKRARELNQGARTDPSLRSDAQTLDKASEGQLAAAGFANRVKDANKQLSTIESTEGFNPTSVQAALLQSVPGGNIALTTEQQQYQQAKSDFITSVLRKESGAVISEEEFAREDKKFFPQVGDKPGVIAQKSKSRDRAFNNLNKQSKGVFDIQFGGDQTAAQDTGITAEQFSQLTAQEQDALIQKLQSQGQ